MIADAATSMPSFLDSYGDLALWLGYVAIVALFGLNILRSREKLSISSHRVVLVGPSRVGKTSSIVAAMDQIRRGKIYGGLARLRSESTITRVSKLAEVLNAGEFPPSTKEDETNVYRFDYAARVPNSLRAILGVFGITTLYRVEVADFAGEQSERYFSDVKAISPEQMPDDYGVSAPHNFLKWISESDVCVIFIDCEKYSADRKAYVQAMTDKYITFWTFYLDIHADNIFSAKAPPVVIAYTKADILEGGYYHTSNGTTRYELHQVSARMDSEFGDLVRFLKQNAGSVRSVATSVVRRDGEERFGISRLVDLILPRRGKI